MKMISGNICLLLAALGMLCSCEDTRLDGMSPDQVYIVQSGVQNIFVDSRDFADFTVTVYKSGLGDSHGLCGRYGGGGHRISRYDPPGGFDAGADDRQGR